MPLCHHFMLVLYTKVYTRFMPRVHRLALYQVDLQVGKRPRQPGRRWRPPVGSVRKSGRPHRWGDFGQIPPGPVSPDPPVVGSVGSAVGSAASDSACLSAAVRALAACSSASAERSLEVRRSRPPSKRSARTCWRSGRRWGRCGERRRSASPTACGRCARSYHLAVSAGPPRRGRP